MTTAISLSDTIYETAEQLAGQLGIPRDELYENALKQYLQDRRVLPTAAVLSEKSITERLDEVYSKHGSKLDPLWVEIQARSIPEEQW